MTIREEASVRLAKNLHKVVQVARMTYNRQSPFYRHCTTLNQHIDRMVNHFFQGFYQEVKAERSFVPQLNLNCYTAASPSKGRSFLQQV